MNIFEHGGMVYDADGRQLELIDFSANINPFGVPRGAREAIVDALDGIVHYPDPEARALKSAIAERYDLNVEQIAVFNGAAEFFYVYFRLLEPKEIFIPTPTFSEYERAASAADIRIEFYPEGSTVEHENVIVCNPNNPTGRLMSIDEILKLKAARVIVDESFTDFVGDEYSVKRFVGRRPNLIVVQSLTKIYAIPGLRLGFAVASPEVIEKLERGKDVWNVNYLAQVAGVEALKDREYVERTRRWLTVEREYVYNRLKAIGGVKVFEPSANFILIRLENESVAQTLIERLSLKKILVRSCGNIRGLDGRYIRLAIRLRAENDRVLEAIEDAMKKIGRGDGN